MKKLGLGIGVAAIMMACCWSAYGAAIVTEDFAGGVGGWVIDDASDGGGAGSPNGSLNGAGGYLEVNSGGASIIPVTDFVFDGGGVFSGDYTAGGLTANGINGISFNFYNPSATPINGLQVYLVAGGNTWYHPLVADVTTGGWDTYGANLSFDSLNAGTGEWFTLAGDNLATWQGDLASVTGMGFRMNYVDNTANQIYRLDNIIIQDDPYILLVPEPQTYAMLGFAFLSMGVTFRRKLEGALASLKAMMA